MTTAPSQPGPAQASEDSGPADIRWFLRPGDIAFDRVQRVWKSESVQRMNAMLILGAFVGTAAWIGLGKSGIVPHDWQLDKPFGYAIHAAFTLVLLTEVITLILSLARSVAVSVGKQSEIFSLILLRQAFEEFSHRGDRVEWVFAWDAPGA